MHTGRRYRPRGGKSNKRKRVRDSFWQAVESTDQTTSVTTLPDPEVEEKTREPVDTLQARAKALRRLANPKPGQSRESSSIVGTSSEVVAVESIASTEKADSTSSQAIVVRGDSESSVAEVNPGSSSSTGVPRSVGCGVVEIPLDPEVEVEIGPGCVLIGEALRLPYSLRELLDDLENCCVLDLYKTVIFPESYAENRDSTLISGPASSISGAYYQASHFRVGRHRGEHQVIFASTAQCLSRLAGEGVVYIGLTFIGKKAHNEYVAALKASKIFKLIPIIIVVNERRGKVAVAERIGAACCLDDQKDHIDRYHRANITAFQVTDSWGLATHPGEVYRQVLWHCLGRDGHYPGSSA